MGKRENVVRKGFIMVMGILMGRLYLNGLLFEATVLLVLSVVYIFGSHKE